MSIDSDVIIIGAGISGLKAASDLNDKGLSTLVLEARSKIGGRIYTERSSESSYHYDFGASWFHATTANPVFDKFVNDWYSNDDTVYDDSNVGFVLNTENGKFPENCNFAPIVDELKQYVSNLSTDQSLQNSTIDFFKSKKSSALTEDEIKFSTSVFKIAELLSAGTWNMISSKFAYGPAVGRDSFNIIGYDKVIEKIIQNYPKENIKLSHAVKTVEKLNTDNENDSIIQITTKDDKVYKCKYLIVTIPLGVLKLSLEDTSSEGAITFKPELPKPITDKFAKTHVGLYTKVFVEYDSAFWPKNDKFLVLSDTNETDFNLNSTKPYEMVEFGKYDNSKPVKAFHFPCLVSNFDVVRGIPALMFLLPPPAATQVENAADPKQYGYELVKPIISKMTGISESELPKPKVILTTSWGNDPYIRGAISTCAVGDVMFNDKLIEGFGNIRFAGEHTIAEGKACAHGAYISGAREAQFIVEKMGK